MCQNSLLLSFNMETCSACRAAHHTARTRPPEHLGSGRTTRTPGTCHSRCSRCATNQTFQSLSTLLRNACTRSHRAALGGSRDRVRCNRCTKTQFRPTGRGSMSRSFALRSHWHLHLRIIGTRHNRRKPGIHHRKLTCTHGNECARLRAQHDTPSSNHRTARSPRVGGRPPALVLHSGGSARPTLPL